MVERNADSVSDHGYTLGYMFGGGAYIPGAAVRIVARTIPSALPIRHLVKASGAVVAHVLGCASPIRQAIQKGLELGRQHLLTAERISVRHLARQPRR